MNLLEFRQSAGVENFSWTRPLEIHDFKDGSIITWAIFAHIDGFHADVGAGRNLRGAISRLAA